MMRAMIALAWIVTLLVSTLPELVLNQIAGWAPAWLWWVKIALLASLAAAGWAVAGLRPLRTYFALLLVLMTGWELFSRALAAPTWVRWSGTISWQAGLVAIQSMKLGVALLTIAALYLFFRRREAFFLVRGSLAHLAAPAPWLGMKKPTPWTILGPIVAGVGAVVMTSVLLLTHLPSGADLARALPLLPAALLFSMTNAFSEEASFRASLLAPLVGVVGKGQAMALTAVFFGLAHYVGGVPLGTLPTLLMTGFLGWFMAKCMVETRGFFWSWFIHFVNDVPVFFFLALQSIPRP
jgi:membrane protease YdiL (CAAX protease family)